MTGAIAVLTRAVVVYGVVAIGLDLLYRYITDRPTIPRSLDEFGNTAKPVSQDWYRFMVAALLSTSLVTISATFSTTTVPGGAEAWGKLAYTILLVLVLWLVASNLWHIGRALEDRRNSDPHPDQ